MGQNKEFIHRSVFAEWKPMLWYTKGDKPNILDTMFDHIESNPPDKSSMNGLNQQ